jgi:hypothetical protein
VIKAAPPIGATTPIQPRTRAASLPRDSWRKRQRMVHLVARGGASRAMLFFQLLDQTLVRSRAQHCPGGWRCFPRGIPPARPVFLVVVYHHRQVDARRLLRRC